MEYISSDTNVWLDFVNIDALQLPFRLPYTYLMNEDAISDEMLSPEDLGKELLHLGLVSVEWTEADFYLSYELNRKYRRISIYDSTALAIAKNRKIVLLTGDKALRKAAQAEGVKVIGTIGILDELYQGRYIDQDKYKECLLRLLTLNGGKVRLPEREIISRLESVSDDEIEKSYSNWKNEGKHG